MKTRKISELPVIRVWNVDHFDEVIEVTHQHEKTYLVVKCECQLTNGALVPEAQVEKETLAKFTIGETK